MKFQQNNTVSSPPFSYRLLSFALFWFWLVHAFVHAFQYKQWSYILQRLNLTPSTKKEAAIWVHASSLGEVNLITPLCLSLIKDGHHLVITTSTASGYKQALKLSGDKVSVRALCIDFMPLSAQFIHSQQFKLALIAETEIWPETLYQAAKQNIPIVHINARLSHKTLSSPAFLLNTLKQSMNYFSHHFVRYPEDVTNFQSLGVDISQLTVMGNLKYAQSDSNQNQNTAKDLIQRPYILLASSHANEEIQIAALFKSSQWPLLVIAPRHPKRASSIMQELKALNLSVAQRSKEQTIDADTQVYLADTFGEMTDLYSFATLVIMGGSFDQTGGHNVLQPAALACCIITGPSDSNIKQDIKDLAQQQAIKQVDSIEQLKTQIQQLNSDKTQRESLAKNAQEFMQTQQFVLQNYQQKLEPYLA